MVTAIREIWRLNTEAPDVRPEKGQASKKRVRRTTTESQ